VPAQMFYFSGDCHSGAPASCPGLFMTALVTRATNARYLGLGSER
jgi:hypothetical protein